MWHTGTPRKKTAYFFKKGKRKLRALLITIIKQAPICSRRFSKYGKSSRWRMPSPKNLNYLHYINSNFPIVIIVREPATLHLPGGITFVIYLELTGTVPVNIK